MNQTATLQKLEEMRLNGFGRIYRQMTGNNKGGILQQMKSLPILFRQNGMTDITDACNGL